MNWDKLQVVSHYATPEVFTVAGVLLGGLAAWKVVGWTIRSVTNLIKKLTFEPALIALLFVGGAATTGWGMARWGEWSYAPMPAPTDLSAFDRQVFAILKYPGFEYQMKAVTEFAKLRATRPLDRESPLEPMSMGPLPPPPPDLGPGVTATFAGIATCIVAIFWTARKFIEE
jgi:hypothetical protein